MTMDSIARTLVKKNSGRIDAFEAVVFEILQTLRRIEISNSEGEDSDPNTTIKRFNFNATDSSATVPIGQSWEISYISADNGDINLQVNGERVYRHTTGSAGMGAGIILFGGDVLTFVPAGATAISIQVKVSMLAKNRKPAHQGAAQAAGPPVGVSHYTDTMDGQIREPADGYDRIPPPVPAQNH